MPNRVIGAIIFMISINSCHEKTIQKNNKIIGVWEGGYIDCDGEHNNKNDSEKWEFAKEGISTCSYLTNGIVTGRIDTSIYEVHRDSINFNGSFNSSYTFELVTKDSLIISFYADTCLNTVYLKRIK
jgi:hypothetical protein